MCIRLRSIVKFGIVCCLAAVPLAGISLSAFHALATTGNKQVVTLRRRADAPRYRQQRYQSLILHRNDDHRVEIAFKSGYAWTRAWTDCDARISYVHKASGKRRLGRDITASVVDASKPIYFVVDKPPAERSFQDDIPALNVRWAKKNKKGFHDTQLSALRTYLPSPRL